MISCIPSTDVNRINSGQVIIDLKSVVKELVENSIDAKSSKVEITFHNYGIDSISIADDGIGIEQKDFNSICLRSHTSKLVEFNDLYHLSSLGFRGEALNSICSIASKVKITTSSKSEFPRNHELLFNNLGNLTKREDTKAKRSTSGTSVFIEKIFSNLPVRHKNFVKNSKKEFHKAVNLLIHYVLIYPEIKFTVNNITSKKNAVLATRGGTKTTTLDNMLMIFGSNGARGLESISLQMVDEMRVEGFISNHSFGMGRSVQDRQFIYINRRPVVHKKIQKVINEVYRQFNHLQFPSMILNFKIETTLLDVNVTPDKMQVLIHNEIDFLDQLRSEFTKFFEVQDNIVLRNNSESTLLSKVGSHKHEQGLDKPPDVQIIQKVQMFDHQENDRLENAGIKHDFPADQSRPLVSNESNKEQGPQLFASPEVLRVQEQKKAFKQRIMHGTLSSRVTTDETAMRHLNTSEVWKKLETKDSEDLFVLPSSPSSAEETPDTQKDTQESATSTTNHAIIPKTFEKVARKRKHTEAENLVQSGNLSGNFSSKQNSPSMYRFKSEDSVHNLAISMEYAYTSLICARSYESNLIGSKKLKINDIQLSEEQEETMSYIISKEDFLRMKLIGQFNLGFILVSLNNQNLFILDQHASDEKFNFERLGKEFHFKYQTLISPKYIQLSVIDEMVVSENRQIFKANGFDFEIDKENQESGTRVKLLALPVSKNHTFGEEDFHELINLINLNHGNKYVKCSKIRNILAMRACRTSIMIGQPLTRKRMANVVQNLNTLEKPWNCPHGRPTMRHLIELDEWKLIPQDYKL